jgi:hypothetical protein
MLLILGAFFMKDIFDIIFQFENLSIVFEIISFSISVYYFKRYRQHYLKYLSLFLILTISVEIIGFILMDIFKKGNLNRTLYNNYLTIEFCFYLFLIKNILRAKSVKHFLPWIIRVYFSMGFINNILLQGEYGSFSSITYSLGCFFVIGFLLYYFYELMLYPSSEQLIRQPAFWICSGLLFFYTSTFTIFGLTNFVTNLSDNTYNYIGTFITITNIVLYSMFSIAFICQPPAQKSFSLLSLEAS